MRKLEVNFAGGAGSAWAGRMLLALAAALSLDVAMSYKDVRAALEANEARFAELQPRGAPSRNISAEEIAAVRDTVERLGLPWNELFAALETAATDQVALLGIEPDPKAGTVVISGDSKDYLAALSYVLNLSRTEALSGVQLVRHEIKANDPHNAVHFTVSASWREANP